VVRGRGVQAEVLVSLAVVMVTATALLAGFFLKTHAAQVERLRGLIGSALAAEVRSPTFELDLQTSSFQWWILASDSALRDRSPKAGRLDAETLALAVEVRQGGIPLLQAGAPWEPIRFASRLEAGPDARVAVALVEPVVSRMAIAALVMVDCLVFTLLGAYLLRGRIVLPLRQLALAAESIADAGPGARVPVEGAGEAADLAGSFNAMSEALERRSSALTKAVSELRETNARLRRAHAGLDRAERLAAVGQLAAGVAHEVGNPMGAMLAFLDLVRREGGLSDIGLGYLEKASHQGTRVREILRQLLDFSRPPRASRDRVDLETVVEQTFALVRAQKRYAEVALELESCEGVASVWGDESMLAQTLLNLVINAVGSVCERPEPRVVVSLRPAHMQLRAGEDSVAAAGRRRPDAVVCEVADNGPGVPEEDRERIFDPFFTTKEPGEGTGLGLANAQRLVEELGGTIDYSPSEQLGGAAFCLRLPVMEAAAQETRRSGQARREG
jgi:two-component system NtrC family sensor kinase